MHILEPGYTLMHMTIMSSLSTHYYVITLLLLFVVIIIATLLFCLLIFDSLHTLSAYSLKNTTYTKCHTEWEE